MRKRLSSLFSAHPVNQPMAWAEGILNSTGRFRFSGETFAAVVSSAANNEQNRTTSSSSEMAKGGRGVERSDENPENPCEHKVPPPATKDNRAADREDRTHRATPRPPLRDTSSMLIQEGNESLPARVPDGSKLRKDKRDGTSDKCGSKEDAAGPKAPVSKAVPATEHTASKAPVHTGRKHRMKKTDDKAPQNRKVTDFFPIRRSNRKTKGELKDEEHRHIEDLIKNGAEEGMQVRHIDGKGRGVFAERSFKKGAFVVEYHGDLLELAEAKGREARYAEDPQTGCYMYYFQYQSKTYCVDATRETNRLGRLINHSKVGNLQTRIHAIDGVPHLILVAFKDIAADEELLYDYGDRSKASIRAHPWLKY